MAAIPVTLAALGSLTIGEAVIIALLIAIIVMLRRGQKDKNNEGQTDAG